MPLLVAWGRGRFAEGLAVVPAVGPTLTGGFVGEFDLLVSLFAALAEFVAGLALTPAEVGFVGREAGHVGGAELHGAAEEFSCVRLGIVGVASFRIV